MMKKVLPVMFLIVLLSQTVSCIKTRNKLEKKLVLDNYIEKLQSNNPGIYCEIALYSYKKPLEEAFNEFNKKVEEHASRVNSSIDRYNKFKQFAKERQKTEELGGLKAKIRILVEEERAADQGAAKLDPNLVQVNRPGSKENRRQSKIRMSNIDRNLKTVVAVCWMPLKVGFKRLDFKEYCDGEAKRLHVVYDGSYVSEKEISIADFQGETSSDKYFYIRSMPHDNDNHIEFDEKHCGLVITGTGIINSLIAIAMLLLIK